MANHRHLNLINRGVSIWNKWRNENPDLKPNLSGADLSSRDLSRVKFYNVNLRGANLSRTNLFDADLTYANLIGADLRLSSLVHTTLKGANITGCKIYGISAWSVITDDETIQKDLLINQSGEPVITVDNLKVAQFIYLLPKNREIRDVINTITSKIVLILGRFTKERKGILDSLRENLRKKNYTPVMFDFDKPTTRDTRETISMLANMAKFILADITDARSIPMELEAIVPHLPSVPVQPILQKGTDPWGMFDGIKHYPWVLNIVFYSSAKELIDGIDNNLIAPAEEYIRQAIQKK